MTLKIQRSQLKGLCVGCSNAGGCMHLARARSPIWRCEEYDDVAPFRSNPGHVVVSAAMADLLRAEPAEPAQGICGNCDNLPTCSLSHSEGGIWHCAEYR